MGEQDNNFSRNHSYQTCERLAFVQDKHRMNHRRSSNKSMALGTAVHKLLENLHTVGKPIKEYGSLDGAYASIINGDNYEIVTSALLIAQQYIRYLDRLVKQHHWYTKLIVIATEYKFSHSGISGVFDLILFDPAEKTLHVGDYKTTKGQLHSYSIAMRGSEQFNIYQHMASTLPFGTDFHGIKWGGIIAILLKTKRVDANLTLLKSGNVSKSKAQNTSYEVFTEYLTANGIPHSKYEDYILWLGAEGASNHIVPQTYTDIECITVYEKFQQRRKHILSLTTLEMCDYNRTFTCATKCPIYDQCIDMSAGRKPNFEVAPVLVGKAVFNFGSKDGVNKDGD